MRFGGVNIELRNVNPIDVITSRKSSGKIQVESHLRSLRPVHLDELGRGRVSGETISPAASATEHPLTLHAALG